MNGVRLALLAFVGTSLIACTAQAQFIGGGGGFYGGSMGDFAPPHSIGGYYPMPYSSVFPGYRGTYGYPAFMGPGFGPYGGFPVYGGGFAGVGAYGTPGIANLSQVSPTVVQSPTLVQSQTVVVPAAAPAVAHTGEEIKLICPKSATAPLTYSLNGTVYTMQPGYSQIFRDDRTWKLEFLRNGQGSAPVTYTLKPGTYRFGAGAEGWELRQVVLEQSLPPAPQPTPLTPSPAPTPIPPT